MKVSMNCKIFFFTFVLLFCINKCIAKSVVVSANKLATEAGMEILAKGGNAVDAAVTMQYTLGLVEPQSSGIGGGGFTLIFMKEQNKLYAFDGRETAPVNIPLNFFEKYKGSRNKFYELVTNPASVGVPSIPLLLEHIHKKFGRLPWYDLHDNPIKLSKKGFLISPRLNALVSRDKFLNTSKNSKDYFFNSNSEINSAKPIGFLLKNKDYANTLQTLQTLGAKKSLYPGIISKNILKDLSLTKKQVFLTQEDFKNYKVIARDPVCGFYRTYKICSMGPPSSGALTLLQALGMLEKFKINKNTPLPSVIHLVSEATRLAFIDRNFYIGDPDFVQVPVSEMLDKDYLKKRANLISISKRMASVQPGNFEKFKLREMNNDISMDSTTHFVVLDKWGNGVSMTSSIESAFGSRIFSQGFFLNNQLTDFSFKTFGRDGRLLQNALEPRKRPLSSMSPTIIFDKDGNLYAMLGSPGGKNIISYVLQTIIGLIDLKLSPQDAVNKGRFTNNGFRFSLEKNRFSEKTINMLKKKGYKNIKEKRHFSGIHVIKVKQAAIDKKIFETGVDPRREGKALIK